MKLKEKMYQILIETHIPTTTKGKKNEINNSSDRDKKQIGTKDPNG